MANETIEGDINIIKRKHTERKSAHAALTCSLNGAHSFYLEPEQ